MTFHNISFGYWIKRLFFQKQNQEITGSQFTVEFAVFDFNGAAVVFVGKDTVFRNNSVNGHGQIFASDSRI